jgi:hypothetical protein
MYIVDIGIGKIIMLSGLACIAGEAVLLGAAIVAAIVTWRQEFK